jgi:hypothetical protein
MLTSAAFLTGSLLIALILPTDEVKRTKDHLKAATQFEFQGIGFGSTGADIKRKWPDCQQSTVLFETDKNRKDDSNFLLINVERYYVPKSAASIPAEYVVFEIYDKHVIRISIVYRNDDLEKAGGVYVIEDQLTKLIDVPNETVSVPNKARLCLWEIDEVKRRFAVTVMEELVTLEAYNTEMDTVIMRKKNPLLFRVK